MTRAAAIVIEDGQVALIRRTRNEQIYYVFPGGRVEPGESPEAAAVREVAEELGLDIALGPLAAIVTFRGQQQFFYHTREICGGVFGTGRGPEMLGQYPPENGRYEPIWLPLEQLPEAPVRPHSIRQLMIQAQNGGWPSQVQEYLKTVLSGDFRQQFFQSRLNRANQNPFTIAQYPNQMVIDDIRAVWAMAGFLWHRPILAKERGSAR